jgi:hypothetical protein
MEKRFISDVCKGQPVRRIGCNGDQVSMAGMAKHLAPLLRLLENRYPRVVFFDRERRDESCNELANQLLSELQEHGVDTENVVIGIADRTIENWILADSGMPENVDFLKAGTANVEGRFGKSIVRKAMLPTVDYNETTTGVTLLKAMRPSVARQNSASFDHFLNQIDLQCWWLDR